MPKISVLMPVRDAMPFLPGALASLQAQTFDDFEVLCVDHGSRDGGGELLAQWQDRDPRFRRLAFSGGGLPDALNFGLRACRGDLVARMDADDLCLPGRLRAQAAFLEADPGLGLAGCGVELFAEGGLSGGYRAYQAWLDSIVDAEDLARELFVECPLPHPGWMARREVYGRLSGYPDEGFPEDYHFLLRAVEAGIRLGRVPETLLRWRDHGRRHSRGHARYGRQAFFGLKARFLVRLFLKGRPCVLWGAGDRARLLARLLKAEGADIFFAVGQAGRGRPTSMHGVPVLAAEEVRLPLPAPLIACVGAPGARQVIRDWCSRHGLLEGLDWVAAS